MKKTLIAAVVASTMATPAFAGINTDNLISKIERAYNAYGQTSAYTGNNNTSAANALAALIHGIDNHGLTSRAGGGQIIISVDQDGHLQTNAHNIDDVADTLHQYNLGALVNALVDEVNADFFYGIGADYQNQEGNTLTIPHTTTEVDRVASAQAPARVGFAAQSLEDILRDAREYNRAESNRGNSADHINRKKADFIVTFDRESRKYNSAVDAVKAAQQVGQTTAGHGYDTYRLRWRGADGRLVVEHLSITSAVTPTVPTATPYADQYDSYADFVTSRAAELVPAE